jgi:hypothetical protein
MVTFVVVPEVFNYVCNKNVSLRRWATTEGPRNLSQCLGISIQDVVRSSEKTMLIPLLASAVLPTLSTYIAELRSAMTPRRW